MAIPHVCTLRLDLMQRRHAAYHLAHPEVILAVNSKAAVQIFGGLLYSSGYDRQQLLQ